MRYGLRIKRIYFDQILSGEKNCEYRDFNPRYKNLLNASEVLLHYQHERKLVADVVDVSVVDTPPELARSGLNFSNRVIKVQLANPRLIAGA